MAEKKYILCVKVRDNGTLKTIPLATNYLKALQKYVAYCWNFDDFLEKLENTSNGDFSHVKKYIRENSTHELYYKSSIDGPRLKIKVLYKDDIDVVTASVEDIKKILKRYIININEIENIPSEKEKIFRFLVDNFGSYFKDPSRYRIENKLNYDNMSNYDESYKKVTSVWQDLGLFEQNINAFLTEIYKDYRKWQEMCLFLKELINDKLYDVGKYIGTKKSFNGKEKPQSLCDIRIDVVEKEIQLKYPRKEEYRSSLCRILDDIKENFKFLPKKETTAYPSHNNFNTSSSNEEKLDIKIIDGEIAIDSMVDILNKEEKKFHNSKKDNVILKENKRLLEDKKKIMRDLSFSNINGSLEEKLYQRLLEIEEKLQMLEDGEYEFLDDGTIMYTYH